MVIIAVGTSGRTLVESGKNKIEDVVKYEFDDESVRGNEAESTPVVAA